MKLTEGFIWRYNNYLKPHFLLDKNLVFMLKRVLKNFLLKNQDNKYCYIYADSTNIGDYCSSLGIKYLIGEDGINLYASNASIKETSKYLKFFKKNNGKKVKIIIGGGGLLQGCFESFWLEMLKSNLSFSLYGVGANRMHPDRSILCQNYIDQIGDCAARIHVRDDTTYELFKEEHMHKLSVGICPSVNYIVNYIKKYPKFEEKYLLNVTHPVDIKMSGGDPMYIRKILMQVADALKLKYDETDHINENLSNLMKRYLRAKFILSSRQIGRASCRERV